MSVLDEFLKVEQDSQGPGDDLPTYDDLAAQSGPNSRLVASECMYSRHGCLFSISSRFGRWKGWIEKR